MVKNEYVIRDKKLYLIKDGEEFECSKEDLTEIIQKQDKNKSQLSDDYLEKVEKMMSGFVTPDVDQRLEVAKMIFQGMISRGASHYAKKDYYDESIYDSLIPKVFKITDKFLEEYKK